MVKRIGTGSSGSDLGLALVSRETGPPGRERRASECEQILRTAHGERVNRRGAKIMVDKAGDGAGKAFQVVVMGTGPVGKTSLINAMLGRSVGETGATMGTTRVAQAHTHVVQGVEGTLLLTDTPGLGEAGLEGPTREAEAIDQAIRADLLVFVVDHDLTRADCQTVFELARRGKRLMVR